jgi:UDP-glucose 4-epimerase
MTMRVAITGTSGLIGSAVRDRLAGTHSIVSVGRHPSNDVNADFADPGSLGRIELGGIEALIHCAGVVDEDFQNDPVKAYRHATSGTAALIARAIACGVRRLAYISSAHVYGPFVGTISEDTLTNPLSDYAIAHFASEQIFRRAVDAGARVAVFRPNAVFGLPPDFAAFRRWSLVPFAFPRDAIMLNKIVLKSPGEQRRNFVGSADVAESVSRWLDDGNAAPGFFVNNPIGRTSSTVWEFAGLCAGAAERLTGKHCELVRVQPAPGAANGAFNYTSCDAGHVGTSDLTAIMITIMEHLLVNQRGG